MPIEEMIKLRKWIDEHDEYRRAIPGAFELAIVREAKRRYAKLPRKTKIAVRVAIKLGA